MAKTNTPTLVELNNKSRKGLYIRYKHPTGRWSYYKLRPNEPIETTIKRYTTPKGKKKKKYRIPKRKTIETQLKKAIKTITITNTQPTTIKTAKNNLFKNIVRDQQILNILTTDHNLQKIKHRFEINLKVYGQNGLLYEANKLNTTPDQAINEIKNTATTGTYADYPTKLKNKGWNTTFHQKGTITKKTITITFRKA